MATRDDDKRKEADKKPENTKVEGNIQIPVKLYRSLVLDKLRAEIAAKRAQLEIAKRLEIPDLGDMAYWKMKYWKMKYWKMKYWKMGMEDPLDQVINPDPSVIKTPQK